MTAVAKLRQALDQLQQASAVAAGGQFDQDAIFTAADALDAAQAGELLRLGGAPTQALSRSLAAALAPLASLEQPLQAALRAPLPDRGMYIRLQAAACAVSGGAQLAACCLDPLPAEVAAALAAGASLLVAAGTPLLANLANPAGRQALRRLFPNNRSARVDRTVKMLADGVANVGNAVLRPAPVLVQQLLGQAPLATGRRPLLKGALAPRRLLPFLSATAAAVLAAADDPADVIDLAYPSAAHLLTLLLLTCDHPKLQTALSADSRLSEQLVRLLLRCLGAAASRSSGDSTMQQPSAENVQELCEEVCPALVSPALYDALRRLLGSDPHAALAAVHDAAAVLRRLPLQPCGNNAAELWRRHYGAATLFSHLLGVLPGRKGGRSFDGIDRTNPAPPPEQERPPLLRQAGQIAVETLPAMAAAAAAASRLVAFTAEPPEQSELLTWLEAADAMLRLLPMPAELAADVAAQPPGVVPADLRNLAAELADRCLGVFSQAVVTADDFLQGLAPADLQPVADAALPALASLHSRACRLVHWAQTSGQQHSALVGGTFPGGWPKVASRVAVAFLNAAVLLQAKLAALKEEGALDSPLGQDVRLMLASLAAAHLEAMPALAKWMGARCLLDSEHGLDSLATAIAWAPALSLSSPAWHSLHASLHQLLQEPESRGLPLADKAGILSLLLLMAGRPIPPHAAAALLPSTAAVLRECSTAPPPASLDDQESLDLFAGVAGASLLVLAKVHGVFAGTPGLAEALAAEPPDEQKTFKAVCQHLVALLPAIEQQAAELHAWWQRPEQLVPARLAAGRAAAVRACAYLACPNGGAEGGMVAGQGAGCKRCGGCRSVWYCGPACSRADWKQHKLVCPLLKADRERQAVSPMG